MCVTFWIRTQTGEWSIICDAVTWEQIVSAGQWNVKLLWSILLFLPASHAPVGSGSVVVSLPASVSGRKQKEPPTGRAVGLANHSSSHSGCLLVVMFVRLCRSKDMAGNSYASLSHFRGQICPLVVGRH